MKEVIYDGSWRGFLCAVFDVYEYKFTDVSIVPIHKRQPSMFAEPHFVNHDKKRSDRVWKGLEKKLSLVAQKQVYRTFLSELDGIENTLLQYIQYAFASAVPVEEDPKHKAATEVVQTAKKVWREKNLLATTVHIQETSDGLLYAVIEPEYNVIPLLAERFKKLYADRCWLIYDTRRRYGIHYDLSMMKTVEINFLEETSNGKDTLSVYGENESIYQQFRKHYFKSINIAARKNTKLHIQHTPRRYWKYTPEKTTSPQGGLQDRLTNWTYRRAS